MSSNGWLVIQALCAQEHFDETTSKVLLYLPVYAYKAQVTALWKNLRCQNQKRRRGTSGMCHRGQIPDRRPLTEPPANIEIRQQVGRLN